MNRLPQVIVTCFKDKFEILRVETVTGGCINDCYHLETSTGDYFLKLNHAKSFPGMFSAEVKGLHLLASANTLKIPAVFEFGEVQGISFLLIEFIGLKRWLKPCNLLQVFRKRKELFLVNGGRISAWRPHSFEADRAFGMGNEI